MKQLDERLATAQDASAKKFGILKDQIAAHDNELNEEKNARETLASEKTGEISRLDNRLQIALEAEQKARREAEQAILQVFDERTNSIKEQVQKEGKSRIEKESKLRCSLEVDIPNLYDNLKEEVHSREAMEQRMLDKAMEEVTHL